MIEINSFVDCRGVKAGAMNETDLTFVIYARVLFIRPKTIHQYEYAIREEQCVRIGIIIMKTERLKIIVTLKQST